MTVAETYGLTAPQLDALAGELDALRAEVAGQLGAEDVRYIRRLIRIQRWSEITGRASLFLGFLPPFWLLGAGALFALQDPRQHGDRPQRPARPVRLDERSGALLERLRVGLVCPAKGWQHYHNYLHHTYTNITDKDRDLGYGVIRISAETRGHRATWATRSTRWGWRSSSTTGSCSTTWTSPVREGTKPWDEAKPSLVNGLRKSASSPSATTSCGLPSPVPCSS